MAKTEPPVIGIDVGGTNITAGLIDSENQIVAREKFDTEADEGPDHVVQRVIECIEQLIKDADINRGRLAGVGLGIPGAIDVNRGVVLSAPNLHWSHITLTDTIAEKVKLPITLDNDVNVGAWGEYMLGSGRGAESLLAVFVGTGIGGGFVFDGKLFHGTRGTAGEIGHTIVDAHAPYGSRTLEEQCSRTAIVNRLVRLINADKESVIPDLAGKKWPRIRSKVLARALKSNDDLSVRIIRESAMTLGSAVANVVTLLSLDCVVIGGGLAEALDSRYVEWIREAFLDNVFPDVCRQCRIAASQLGDDAGLLGAALLARDRLGSAE